MPPLIHESLCQLLLLARPAAKSPLEGARRGDDLGLFEDVVAVGVRAVEEEDRLLEIRPVIRPASLQETLQQWDIEPNPAGARDMVGLADACGITYRITGVELCARK